MNGYTTVAGQDQNGQTIKQYTNNQSQCKSDCDSTGSCQGMVTNGSNCWTINSFPSPYSKSGSTTYKKNPQTSNFNGYSMLTGQDQNGQSIKEYTNNTQQQCNSDCNSNSSCQGMVLNGTNCWTIKSFPSPYSNPGSTTYKKSAPAPAPPPPPPPVPPPSVNFNGYTTILGQDQNGQTIKQYTNNQSQCNTDCNSNSSCQGMVINSSNCWTINSFPSPYSNPSSGTYKKQPPTVNFNGYTATPGQDQNGQTIKQYTNNQSQCNADCNSNNNCQGMVINGSNCWTINSFPSPYSNPGSTTYKKNPPTSNFNQYNKIIGQDQNGQTIKQYNNNTQSQCNTDCNSDNNCKGMVLNGSNCWTVKGFPSPYSNPGSAIYEKMYEIPAVTTTNFPTSANNNLYSSVFCKNISTNNGFIQKSNSTFNNLPVYNTQTTPDENTCLNNCNADKYCSSYSFQNNNSSSNCSLYNQLPTSIANNNNINSGYKSNYNYDFNNLNSSQKNVIRNDCINNYLNNNYDTNNIDYSSYYSLGNNNSELNFNAESLANLYGPLGKVQTKHVFTNNPDTDKINATTNQELNNFSNNYTGYLQTQIGTINSSNENNIDSYYNEEINHKTNIQSSNAKNNLLQKKNINTDLINKSINGSENNNITENFGNNNESNNNDKSKTIKFYLFIFIVIIFLYIVYYLKKNKHFK